MAITIRHAGIYRFGSNAHSGYSLNAYTSGAAGNGTNLCLYTSSNSDKAQQWRVLCAGEKTDGKKLFFLNLIANGTDYGNNMALDRNTATTNKNNAHTYKSSNSSPGNDQLVYFEDRGTNLVSIRLFSDGRALTGNAPGATTGGTSNGSATAAANVHWATYSTTNANQKWTVTAISTTGSVALASLESYTKFPQASFFNTTNNSNFPDYLGECVWYVKGRYHEKRKKKFPVNGNANALWGNSTGVMSHSDPGDPVANSVACWNGGQYGHVAFVESVSGGRVYYSQANFDTGAKLSNGQIQIAPAGEDGRPKSDLISDFEGMYGSFKGYIY